MVQKCRKYVWFILAGLLAFWRMDKSFEIQSADAKVCCAPGASLCTDSDDGLSYCC